MQTTAKKIQPTHNEGRWSWDLAGKWVRVIEKVAFGQRLGRGKIVSLAEADAQAHSGPRDTVFQGIWGQSPRTGGCASGVKGARGRDREVMGVLGSYRASRTLSRGSGIDPDCNGEHVQGSKQRKDMTYCVGSARDKLEAVAEVGGREAWAQRVEAALGRGTNISCSMRGCERSRSQG